MKTANNQKLKQQKLININLIDKQILSLEAASKGLSLKAYLEQEISRLAEIIEDKWLAVLAQKPDANAPVTKNINITNLKHKQ